MKPNTTNVKKAMASAVMGAALGIGGLVIAGGIGHAAPGNPGPPAPPIPGPVLPGNWTPAMPPGQNPLGPPGQVMKMPTVDVPGVGGIANPFYGVPPGHWDDARPLNLVWNATLNAWGVFVNDVFVPYPIVLPAP